ncbi:putative 3-hydroxyisobutyrate dehydrogenase-like 2, mitochondrial [Capsicum annuum]|uniref:probable 3-hydroxyisobutyrate dehydrogenase-like 2, mitochondrial n=1 Tax=Capsicum annuum TaxID=4072 RepID=UPI001FB0AC52|nr:probable 3-hydroxyisobutyrate dehydrogenase-like 2, mitochondrial [Capsicum annuum]XP_047255625.1 probable 3-hydroxyisobutyrate dehydrogenase-like 2, mitochondrial [Capsicum annuum]
MHMSTQILVCSILHTSIVLLFQLFLSTVSQTPTMTSYQAPINPTRTRIGWIGTGVMGDAMASRLLSVGYSVTIYARNPSKVAHLQSQGALLADFPANLSSNDVIFTMLGHPSDVRQIILDNLVPFLNQNTVIIDHTSSHLVLAKQIFYAARERDCWAVDAPVSGGAIGAKEGKLAILAGGNEDVVKCLMLKVQNLNF